MRHGCRREREMVSGDVVRMRRLVPFILDSDHFYVQSQLIKKKEPEYG